MGYLTWKVAHVLGMLLLFAALGGVAALRQAGAAGSAKLYNALHGAALLLILVAGFGALASVGLHGPGSWPAWVWIKLAVWLVLGAGLTLLARAGRRAGLVLVGLVLLGTLAAWAALAKPAV